MSSTVESNQWGSGGVRISVLNKTTGAQGEQKPTVGVVSLAATLSNQAQFESRICWTFVDVLLYSLTLVGVDASLLKIFWTESKKKKHAMGLSLPNENK